MHQLTVFPPSPESVTLWPIFTVNDALSAHALRGCFVIFTGWWICNFLVLRKTCYIFSRRELLLLVQFMQRFCFGKVNSWPLDHIALCSTHRAFSFQSPISPAKKWLFKLIQYRGVQMVSRFGFVFGKLLFDCEVLLEKTSVMYTFKLNTYHKLYCCWWMKMWLLAFSPTTWGQGPGWLLRYPLYVNKSNGTSEEHNCLHIQ